MVNVTKLLVDKKISITRGNCPTLDWFIYIKTEPLEDEHSRDIYILDCLHMYLEVIVLILKMTILNMNLDSTT